MLNRLLAVLLAACAACAGGDDRRAPPRAPARPADPAQAPVVTIVEFFDYGCHFCAEFDSTVMPVLRREYLEPGRVRWRLVPFGATITPYAADAATALACAAAQDREWAMHARLFERRREWMLATDRESRLREVARAASLDQARFAECWRSPRTRAEVGMQRHSARQVGVRIVPTFLVNGGRIEGVTSLADFRAAIASATR